MSRKPPRLLVTFLIGLLVAPAPAWAQTPAEPSAPDDAEGEAIIAAQPDASDPIESSAVDVPTQLAEGRRLLTEGSYDEAMAILGVLIDEARGDLEILEQVYLQLIKAYMLAGNHYRFRARGTVTADLYYQQGDQLILECLRTAGLEHTTPDPPHQYPPEMLSAFERVRADNFGALRIIQLEPPEAVVLLNGTTIKWAGPSPLPEVPDLVEGEHRIVVSADGYDEWTEQIRITPGTTLERAYKLEKRKGFGWWSLRAASAAAVVTIVAVIFSGGSDTPSDLPAPPPPPD